MNILELSAVLTLLAGAINGGDSAKSASIILTAIGVVLGLLVGIVVYVGTIGFVALLMHVFHLNKTKLNPVQQFASVTGVFLPMLAPFLAWWLSGVLVTATGL
jgi:hypothetical protein